MGFKMFRQILGIKGLCNTALPHANHSSLCNAANFMYIVKFMKQEIRLQSGFFT
jgi:hypothetical protein